MQLKDFRSNSIESDYNKSLETDTYTFFNYADEPSICPICAANVKESLLRSFCLNIKKCSCGFMGVFPRPREKDLKDFYEHGRSNKLWHDILIETKDKRKDNYIKTILPLLKNVMGNIKSLVDVGCDEGIWLEAIYKKFPNIKLFGMEPFASNKPEHYELIEDFIEDYTPVKKFDACTLLSVIEHVADPVKILRLCGNIMNKDGIIFIIAPNVAGFDYAALPIEKRNWEVPQHINFFTLSTLINIVKNNGFNIVDAGTFGYLDVEIVAKMVKDGDGTRNEFLDTVLVGADYENFRKQFQKIITKNGLSNQAYVIGKLK